MARNLIALLFLLAVVGLVVISRKPAGSVSSPSLARVLYLTNCVAKGMATAYAKMSPENAKTIEEWEQTKTNTVVVEFVNRENVVATIFPFLHVEARPLAGSTPATNRPVMYHQALLLTAANFSGLRVPSGSTAQVDVAVFGPIGKPWRVCVNYTRDQSSGFLKGLTRLPRNLLNAAFGRPNVVQAIPVYTPWMETDGTSATTSASRPED